HHMSVLRTLLALIAVVAGIAIFIDWFAFFYYLSRHHPYLHSFPTRRSSDLVQYVAAQSNTRGQIIAGNQNWNTQVQGTDVDLPRSEEHTSELQSPYDLVCRLLLEKKNCVMPTRIARNGSILTRRGQINLRNL